MHSAQPDWMDYRWAFLFQSLTGHKFEPEVVERLASPGIDSGDLNQVLDALGPHPLSRDPDRWVAEAERVLEKSWKAGIRWSTVGCHDYPLGWTRLEGARPLVFSYQGEPVWLDRPTISIVGSRTPMRETCLWMQSELSRFFSAQDLAVVSGGARGVDQWAHRICMDSGRPTVCVFPSGLLEPYPPGIETFTRRILETGGALVSALAPDQAMRKRYFLERNRWIAGLSPMTFVVEANRRSGSSMTAKLAHEAHREVCTLPVFPYSAQGLGNLDLLARNQACLVRDHRDLMDIWSDNSW